MVARGRRGERNCSKGKIFYFGVIKIAENQVEVVIAQPCKFTKMPMKRLI